MIEREITSAFIQAQGLEYYEMKFPMMGKKFLELIRMKEAIENGLKSRKVISVISLQAPNKSSPLMAVGFPKKNKDNVSIVSFSPRTKTQR